MQRLAMVVWVVAVVGCSDDGGGNKVKPDTAVVSGPAVISNEGHVQILFEARGNANGFFCQLDGNTPSPCISPFEADVGDGDHLFEVAAALNQNVDDTPATHTWRTDTVVPETTITSAPPTLDNSVMPSIAFAGSDPNGTAAAAPGSVTFECALDGAAFTACTSPITLDIVDGIHAFAVRSKDEAGNVDPTPAEHGWTIDSTAPETAITTGPSAGATSGPSGSFAFDSTDVTATFECAFDGATFAACTSPQAFTLGDGAHTFAVRAKDPSGLVDPSPATRAWTVDAIGPAVTITTTPADPSNVTTPMFAFSSVDVTATFECQIDGVVAFTACTSPFTAPALADGTRTFRVRGTDGFANVGTPATFAWTVDTVAPTVTFTTLPAALSNDTTPTAAFTTAGGAVTIECRADAGTFAACTSPFTSAVLGNGLHTISVRATDAAGNAGTFTTAMFEIDTVAPTAAFTSQPLPLSNDTTPTVQFTTAGNPSLVECRVDAGAFASCTTGFTPTVGEGTHTISVRVSDAATNSSTITTNNFVVDTTPPTVTITGAPAALGNNKNPQVVFTTGGAPVLVQCRLDAGALATCTSPHTIANVPDGAHTITVRVEDGAGNAATATTPSFTIDTVGPVVTITEGAPAAWPVNYFDFGFTTGDAVTIECAVDAAAFTACASPHTTTVTYDVAHQLHVRGTDAAGNATVADSAAWTPKRGMVLHYPWEQGGTANTSLLRQRPAHSPNGSAASVAFVGGWAGSALGGTIAAHTYPKTIRPLTSSSDGAYTASFWLRATDASSATTVFSTIGGTDGLRVSLASNILTVEAVEAGQSQSATTAIAFDRWVHVGLRTTGVAKGVAIFIDGNLRTSLSSSSGFGSGQASALTVGAWSQLDIDDLRFFNLALSNAEMCSTLARGFVNANGGCVPLSPGFEIDFERTAVVDTGSWDLALNAPQALAFGTLTLGGLFHLTTSFDWGFATGGPSFGANVAAVPGRSFSFEFVPGTAFGRLIDFRIACNAATGGGGQCGMSVDYADNTTLTIYTGTATDQKTTTIGTAGGLVANRFNNVVVTEQRSGGATTSITVFVNGVKTVIAIASGDIYARVNDDVRFVQTPNLVVDEYEFWQRDLAASTEILCENGFDGEFDVASGTCLLTYGP